MFPATECDVCGTPFVPWRAGQRGCSPGCMRVGRLRRKLAKGRKPPPPPVACRVCRATFHPDRRTAKVCATPECKAEDKRRLANSLTAGRGTIGAEHRECVICGGAFVGHRNAVACSRPCRLLRQREHTRRRLGTPEYRCVLCRKAIPPDADLRTNRYTCSPACRAEAGRVRQARGYAANPQRRERMTERVRERKATDPAFRQRLVERDAERRAKATFDAIDRVANELQQLTTEEPTREDDRRTDTDVAGADPAPAGRPDH